MRRRVGAVQPEQVATRKGAAKKQRRLTAYGNRAFSWFAAVLMVFTAAQILLPTGVLAQTATVLPNGDVTTQWNRCNNTTCSSPRYTYIDEDVNDSPNTSDYINTGTTTASDASAAVEFDMTSVASVDTATSVTVDLYTYIATVGGSQNDTLSVQLRFGGVLTAAVTVSPGTGSYAKHSATFNGSWNQAQIDGMRVLITRNTRGTTGSQSNRRDDVRIAALSAVVTYTSSIAYVNDMSAYRWMDTSRNPLGAANTPVTLTSVGTPFRMRSSIHMASDDNSTIPAGNKSYKLEYAERVGTCDINFTGEEYQSMVPGIGEWEIKTASASFGNRSKHQAITFDNKIWVLGGWNGWTFFNDVWYSSDGVNWDQATASAGWSPRYEFEALVYDNKMWVIGGFAASGGDRQDVWYSSDGVNWTQATASAGWSARYGLGTTVYDNKMWVMGGFRTSSGVTSDVWYSTDGANWTQATASADWSPRSRIYPTSEVFADRMWIFGGTNGGSNFKEVWSSTNGTNWTKEFDDPGWPEMQEAATAVLGNTVYITGGDTGSGIIDDVWGLDTNSPVISYYDDPGTADGASISSTANDPSHSGHTIVYQNFVESDGFTNTSPVPSGQDAMWEFSLMTSEDAPADTTYCIRIVESDGTPLDTYSVIAEISTPPPYLNQAAMRWYNAAGSPLAAQDSYIELAPPGGDVLRLRMLITVTQIRAVANSLSLKLQYAPKVGTCDIGFSGESYVDFTTVGTNSLSYYDNGGIADGSAITAGGNDPTYVGFDAVPQTFVESNNFSNATNLAVNEAGLWEFSVINNLQEGARYCIRVVHEDNSLLDEYTSIAELWVPPGISQQMRHGRFFDANQSGESFIYW